MLAEELDSVEEGERIAGGALEIGHINKQAKRNKKDRDKIQDFFIFILEPEFY